MKFIWDKKKKHTSKNNPNGWCVCVGSTVCGKNTEYQVSDTIERSESYDFLSLDDAFKECIRLNKQYPLEEQT